MELLDQKLPNTIEFRQDLVDQNVQDVVNTIESFEKIFVAYINENYRSFTEQDLQRLIKDELKQHVLSKVS